MSKDKELFTVYVQWSNYGVIQIEADSIEQAMELAWDRPLAEFNAAYSEDTFEINEHRTVQEYNYNLKLFAAAGKEKAAELALDPSVSPTVKRKEK